MQTTRVAVVTGAGRGIGAAIAERLASDGFLVIAADIDAANATRTRDSIVEAGHLAEALALDVADRAAVAAAFDGIAARHGRLDVVVNNAMWIRYGPLSEMDEPTIDRMIAVGLKSLIWTSQSALPIMRKQGGGCIVNVSSPAAVKATQDAAVYAAVKGGVTSLTWQLSSEFGRQGIRVNAVVPGAVPTEGARQLVDEAGYAARQERTPLGRLGRPEDLANAVSFLVSDEASFVNGHLLAVDGGILVS